MSIAFSHLTFTTPQSVWSEMQPTGEVNCRMEPPSVTSNDLDLDLVSMTLALKSMLHILRMADPLPLPRSPLPLPGHLPLPLPGLSPLPLPGLSPLPLPGLSPLPLPGLSPLPLPGYPPFRCLGCPPFRCLGFGSSSPSY